MAWSKLVSTELSDEKKLDMSMPTILGKDVPEFPYGMRISMDEELLERLDLEADCEVGDYLDLRCFAVVTSVSKNKTNSGMKCCVELQIEKVAIEPEFEHEDPDADEDDEK